jgi:hypothetical protein
MLQFYKRFTGAAMIGKVVKMAIDHAYRYVLTLLEWGRNWIERELGFIGCVSIRGKNRRSLHCASLRSG